MTDGSPEGPGGEEVTRALEGAATLGPVHIRELAERLSIRPTKQWGQNFVIDANTVRRIVRLSGVGPSDDVLEVGPGLGSLTLPLLAVARSVTAVEIDPTLAAQLETTVAAHAPSRLEALHVLGTDALTLTRTPVPPTALVANLPYNVSVPVLLTLLARFDSIERVLVMVQLEVAQRLAAGPGSKTYGVPSLKAAWYADVRLVGTVPRSVFWPVPNVDSGLVSHPASAPAGRGSRGDVRLHRRRLPPAAQVAAGRPRGVGRGCRSRPGRPRSGRDRPPHSR